MDELLERLDNNALIEVLFEEYRKEDYAGQQYRLEVYVLLYQIVFDASVFGDMASMRLCKPQLHAFARAIRLEQDMPLLFNYGVDESLEMGPEPGLIRTAVQVADSLWSRTLESVGGKPEPAGTAGQLVELNY